MSISFDSLGLSKELLSAIKEQGYNKPTPIQQRAIPAIIKGRDIIAAAQTGTGKTAGFTLPLLQRLAKNPKTGHQVRALIVTPTRELAAQVLESVESYGRHLPFKACAVFGGVKINAQIARIRKGCDILIATPGRLLDLTNQGVVKLSAVEVLVLDEADRMLDMGFIHDIRRIITLLPRQRQSLLFSATFSNDITNLASKLLQNPEFIQVARQNTTAKGVTHLIHPVDKSRKRELLSFLIGSENWQQVLVFTRTKHGANRLSKQLVSDGLESAAIHGDKSQGARTRALTNFKDGKVRVLVATDIAARGLDIDKLPYVVNYDLPNIPEDYVHRIGRTGRADQEGLAVSLVSHDEVGLLQDIERLLNFKIPEKVYPGYEPENAFSSAPTSTSNRKPSSRTRQVKVVRKSSGRSSARRAGGSGEGSRRSGSYSEGSRRSGSRTEGSRRAGGSSEGSRRSGSRTEGSRRAGGSSEDSRRSGSRTEGSRRTGSRLEGSRRAGGSSEGSRRSGSRTEGSRRAGGSSEGSRRSGSYSEGSRRSGGNSEGSSRSGSRTEGSRRAGGSSEGSRRSGGRTEGSRRAGGSSEGSRRSGSRTEGSRRAGGNSEGSRRSGGRSEGSRRAGSHSEGSRRSSSNADGLRRPRSRTDSAKKTGSSKSNTRKIITRKANAKANTRRTNRK